MSSTVAGKNIESRRASPDCCARKGGGGLLTAVVADSARDGETSKVDHRPLDEVDSRISRPMSASLRSRCVRSAAVIPGIPFARAHRGESDDEEAPREETNDGISRLSRRNSS